MPREEPFFKKCCYCIPLKSCLQVWSCIKSMADVSLAAFLIFIVILLDGYHELYVKEFTLAHMLIIFIILLVIDSMFMAILTVGLCTNNLHTLRVFSYYSIYMVFMGCACFVGLLVYALVYLPDPGGNVLLIVFMVCGLINSVLDVCIIFTLKSEIIKLRNKQQYEFVEMPTLDKEDEELREPVDSFQADAENFDE